SRCQGSRSKKRGQFPPPSVPIGGSTKEPWTSPKEKKGGGKEDPSFWIWTAFRPFGVNLGRPEIVAVRQESNTELAKMFGPCFIVTLSETLTSPVSHRSSELCKAARPGHKPIRHGPGRRLGEHGGWW